MYKKDISFNINHIFDIGLKWERLSWRYSSIINSLAKSEGENDNKIMVENNWPL